ncbi:glycosyltransferase family 2 protein [uncultured Gemmiger sp.]|uniref:glycosyltransferase family 2 protein n=1 Tax=uncultured Gemmiger sp. TaxID=1623490 RepID=UPI0025E8E8DD|nr:glycosyltransferase family 2 protein [uncultured Gemmiger sp.]
MQQNPQDQNRPADVAAPDSVGGMAKRLMDPAHLKDLAARSLRTLQQQGLEQLWRDVTFRVGLAFHHDGWRYRADIPLRRTLRAQRAENLQGPCISVVVPVYNTPMPFFRQMVKSVRRQTYRNWQLVLVDASDEAHPQPGQLARRLAAQDSRILYEKIDNGGIAANTTAGFAAATGEAVALLDHDDLLYPNALYECAKALNEGADFVYSDEIVLSADLKKLGGYHFKPDFAPDYLRGCNYITHLAVFTRKLLDRVGAAEYSEFDGAQDHELFLRLTERAKKIVHIKQVLYVWRGHAGSTAAGMEAKPYAVEAGVRAVDAQLARLGMRGKAMPAPGAPGAFQVRYELNGRPLVSVLIPNKDHIDDLDRCLRSLYKNAGYDNFEVLVIENNSTDPATFAYYDKILADPAMPRCKVVRYHGGFNFSAINNFGARYASGEYLLLLNNDIEILSHDFVRELLSYAQRADVGAVGAKLYYPDDTIQHAGVLMGINGSAGHSHKSYPRKAVGDLYRLVTTQNYMAVTGACLMTRACLYRQMGGLDEKDFAVAYNDVDYCLKLWKRGLLNVYTPRAEAYHYESKSRGLDTTGENARRYEREKTAFYNKYRQWIDNYDPYYNPHFNNLYENFGLK